MKYKFRTKPFKHQVSALKRALKQDYIALLWEPGLGKSKLIVDWVCALHMLHRLDRVLIICPLSVVGVWEDEFEKHATVPYRFHVLERTDKSIPRYRKLTICVANYDRAWRRQPLIGDYDPQMVVADESHRIKKPSTKRSRFLRKLNGTPFRAILTGTPTPKSFLDLYGQWVFLNPERFGTNFAAYKRQYVIFGGYMNYQVRGYQNVEELKSKVRRDASIRTKKGCLDLPEQTFQRVPVVLEDEAMAAYRKMEYELFLELTQGEVSDAKNVAVKILRLQQITGGWIKSDEGNLHQLSRAKLIACQERLEDLWNDDERVVVFGRFRPEIQAIADLGIRAGIPTYVLSGDIRREDRDESRRKFQAEAGPSLFVAQIQAGGLGITLHSAAEVIFYSVTYALDDYIQACDRVHRIGQTRNVRYQHLAAVGTIDLDVYANLRAKRQILDIIMEDPGSLAKTLESRLTGTNQEDIMDTSKGGSR